MSDHGHTGHGTATDPTGGADAVDYTKVIGVGVGSLIIFALAIWWSAMILHGKVAETQAKTGVARNFDRTREEIGIVDQVPFTADTRLPRWRVGRKAALESYGWLDKAHGRVHIPIEAAIDQVLAGVMPAGAPK